MELTLATLAFLSALPLSSAEKVIGAYIFHRHGDRTTKAWPPVSLTALGADEVYASGSYYRSHYLSPNSSTYIQSISTTIPTLSQLSVTAPVDDVLQNSAQVFVQGLYPPAGDAAMQTLANGSKVESPLGGYQYIPVNAVSLSSSSADSESSDWLQAGSGCGAAVVSSNQFFSSAEYLSTLASTQSFYQSLMPVINTTFTSAEADFENAYTIYDYIYVATIHNTTIPSSGLLTAETMLQLQTRASQHELGLAYNASEPIRAIDGSVLAGQILQFLNATVESQSSSSSSAPVLGIQFGAYGTFFSFFGLADMLPVSVNFTGMVNYASSIVFELVAPDSSSSPDDYFVRFLVANGSASDTNPPQEFPLFGQNQTLLPWSDFVSGMQKFAIADTPSWCKACGETTGTCAVALGLTGDGNGSTSATSSDSGKKGGLSNAVAGVIGALVTLGVILGLEALVMVVGGLRLVKKKMLQRPVVEHGGVTEVNPKA